MVSHFLLYFARNKLQPLATGIDAPPLVDDPPQAHPLVLLLVVLAVTALAIGKGSDAFKYFNQCSEVAESEHFLHLSVYIDVMVGYFQSLLGKPSLHLLDKLVLPHTE